MFVDRKSRDELVEAIDSYLHDELTAFQFDDAIFQIRDQTKDETVKHAVDMLWYFYDDCDDHQVVLDRVGWNYIQRLRILLKSDAALEVSQKRLWSPAQLMAGIALAAFLWAVYRTGVGEHLWLVALPFGVVSIALSKWRAEMFRNAWNCDLSIYPFTSVAQLLWVGHDVRGFRKERYPEDLASRQIRDGRSLFVVQFQGYVAWLLFSPIALAAQLFPVCVPERKVVL
jgi:hypothetical protein